MGMEAGVGYEKQENKGENTEFTIWLEFPMAFQFDTLRGTCLYYYMVKIQFNNTCYY